MGSILNEELIQERMGEFFRENMSRAQEQVKRNEEFLKIINKKCPDLLDEFNKYFQWYIESIDEDMKGIYLHGLRDGARLVKDLKIT